MREELKKNRVIPVVKINDAEKAVPLAKAVQDGGLGIIEITFRTGAAETALRRIKEKVPTILLGAGTVLTAENLAKAINAGADFVVSPGFNPRIVDRCLAEGIPVFPGVCTPTEVEAAMAIGLRLLKFFPAELAGGTAMLKALSTVYEVEFMPTGGINQSNMTEYLSLPGVVCVGGSWMVRSDLIDAGDFEHIRRLTREAVETGR